MGAVDFMRSSEAYSEVDIERFYCYPDGKTHNLPYLKMEMEENEYLPAGWKCRTVSQGILVMSGEGDRFQSYIKAVEFMKDSEAHSEEDIERFYCYPDGKNHSPHLSKLEWEAAAECANYPYEADTAKCLPRVQ